MSANRSICQDVLAGAQASGWVFCAAENVSDFCLSAGPLCKEALDRTGVERAREEEALAAIAALVLQQGELQGCSMPSARVRLKVPCQAARACG